MRENSTAPKSKAETRNSSKAGKSAAEVTSPVKQPRNLQKRKGGPQAQVYRRVDPLLLTNSPHQTEGGSSKENASLDDSPVGSETEREPKKKKPTPNNSDSSAAAASQSCQGQ